MSKRRRRIPDDTLAMYWCESERDFVIHYPSSPDGHLVHGVFNCPRKVGLKFGEFDPAFTKELERRGYDLATLTFSVKRKPKEVGQ